MRLFLAAAVAASLARPALAAPADGWTPAMGAAAREQGAAMSAWNDCVKSQTLQVDDHLSPAGEIADAVVWPRCYFLSTRYVIASREWMKMGLGEDCDQKCDDALDASLRREAIVSILDTREEQRENRPAQPPAAP
jgi:hypothetical protein